MLQHLIILLDDTSVSFCHYRVKSSLRQLMPIEKLERGIRFGMMENLMIQFCYPDYELPRVYQELIDSIDHTNIKPVQRDADVWVTDRFDFDKSTSPVVVRVDKNTLFSCEETVCEALRKTPRLNIVLTDMETFTKQDVAHYEAWLARLAESVGKLLADGASPQLNILTDRLVLSRMNNCGAGEENITLAPNGMFYVCPAFYYEDITDSVGDLEHGLDIKNRQLYSLDHAKICSHCDAWQCKRCIWLNRKMTNEVNTPSHEQCVMSHLERNASRSLLDSILKNSALLSDFEEIEELDYLDPFEKRNEWD